MSNAPQKNKNAEEFNGILVGGLLAKAPKTVVVVAVVLADFLFSSGLVFSGHANWGDAGGGQVSCERGSCERQPTKRLNLADSAKAPTGKPRMLEFTSAHCASCARMAPIVKSMERDCTARDGTILQIDVDRNEGEELAERYRVNQLPTFVMVDSNGDEIARLTGEQPRQRLAVALADINGVLCVTL